MFKNEEKNPLLPTTSSESSKETKQQESLLQRQGDSRSHALLHLFSRPAKLAKVIIILLGLALPILLSCKCYYLLKHNGSHLNLTQASSIYQPRGLETSYLTISVVFSIGVLIASSDCSGFLTASEGINHTLKYRKSIFFWYMVLFFLIVIPDGAISMKNSNGDIMIYVNSGLLIINRFLTILVVFRVNYLYPPERSTLSGILYWLILISFLLENLYLPLENLCLLAEFIAERSDILKKIDSSGVLTIVIQMAKLALHPPLVTFFWNKIWNGKKDLLSEAAVLKDLSRPAVESSDLSVRADGRSSQESSEHLDRSTDIAPSPSGL